MFFLIPEESFHFVFEAFVERTGTTSLWKIRMIVTECVPILSRIVLQASLRLGRFHVLGTYHGGIGGFKRALAVPSVTWVMLIPERIIHREGEFHLPIDPVVSLRLLRGSRHPSEVWKDVLVSLELPPVGSSVRTDYGRIILSLQPGTHLVGTDGAHVFHPFGERFQLAVGIIELCGHLLAHGVNLEGGKHLVGVSECPVEVFLMGWWGLCLGKTFHGSLVDDTQHLTPHGSLYSVFGIEAPINGFQELGENVCIEADCTIHVVEMVVSALALMVSIIKRINQKSVSAPIAGATPKKLFKRSLNGFLSVFKGSSLWGSSPAL